MSLPITSNIKSKYHHRHDIKTTYKPSSSSSPSNFIIATSTPTKPADNHYRKDSFVSTYSSPASSISNNNQRTSRFGSWITTDDDLGAGALTMISKIKKRYVDGVSESWSCGILNERVD
ncbi:hypothetical protein MKW94_015046 [Papaver nudicaule]|uniref:Uncharacterized protein n=1 Tax=Papaver nudicaule TaxID=74823 RepID=A0AA42B3Z3_PAPNU|nr:hypothetical protein [Papaver nudicaule]